MRKTLLSGKRVTETLESLTSAVLVTRRVDQPLRVVGNRVFAGFFGLFAFWEGSE
jgi:hypothetical protein